jgi:hypothetical protein
MGLQGLFPLTHWCSCALNGCLGGVQYSLIGIHVHSQLFRGCSILTQRHSRALTSIQGMFSSDTNVIFLMVTPWWVAFNNSMVFMRTQWVFTLTQCYSCALNGCSGTVPTLSLVFMRTQWVFRGCSILTHWRSCALTSVQEVFNTCSAYSCTWRPNEYVFTFVKHAEAL